MTTATIADAITEKQVAFITRLTGERDVPVAGRSEGEAFLIARHEDVIGGGKFVARREASKVIEWLLALPRAASAPASARAQAAQPQRGGRPSATPGVYQKDGRIYIVRPTRDTAKLPADQQRCLALELIGTHGKATRMTESGDEIPFELDYRRGFVYELTQDDRMSNADAEQLMVLYKRCLCGRALKAADSVRRGMGPVCAKRYMI